jgi:hypothetical protein
MRVDPTNPFWDWVAIGGPEECWPWQGALTKDGYGGAWVGTNPSRSVKAHRVAYEIVHGKAPVEVSHLCHNRLCCNPRHLLDEPHSENMRRAKERGSFSSSRRPSPP